MRYQVNIIKTEVVVHQVEADDEDTAIRMALDLADDGLGVDLEVGDVEVIDG